MPSALWTDREEDLASEPEPVWINCSLALRPLWDEVWGSKGHSCEGGHLS